MHDAMRLAVLAAGDDVTLEEARELVPNIAGAVVKWALGREAALHLSHEAACKLIRQKATEACAKITEIEPYYFPGPYTFEARMQEGCSVQRYLRPGAEVIDKRTVCFTEENICRLPI